MKRLCLLLVTMFCYICANAQDVNEHAVGFNVVPKGVNFEKIGDNEAQAILTSVCKGEIAIPESIKIGRRWFVVVQMGKRHFDFGKNSKIKTVILPNTIMVIKRKAFAGCTNLQKIVLPYKPYVIEEETFDGCNNLAILEGNTLPLQKHINEVYSAIARKVPKFSTYAESKLKERMEFWQKKKAYETAEQYRNRVTDENRHKRMDEFVSELKEEYAASYAPNSVYTSLGNYDSEYEIYIIKTDFYGQLFAQVPKNDAANFRQNYSKVQVIPQFGVTGDTLSIEGSQFKLGDKVYASAENYVGNGGTNTHSWLLILHRQDKEVQVVTYYIRILDALRKKDKDSNGLEDC